MRKTFMSATLASLVLAAGFATGCSNGLQYVRRVDPSVLPASSKSMFQQDAQITRVEEFRDKKGGTFYRVHYTASGRNEEIMINAKDQTTPTGVFGPPAN